ncbi:D-proline reductase (dithiol) proprotein PrdA [Paraclostridium bifermentans]|jgi:D-proline reductase (dithiol) PrdA|uniref:D-proline reductase proprotein prdA n=1 Tax=Paraclostridium bifermentans ATCC 638 = DSM 14991 TaxID=1233171 RepID=T4VKM3_PARBF|nr:D-proline reductase (dithiol) proprotein PrdA [Paraclostridium bifermentans]RDC50759.1 D-proline reductase (dithiol) proprotein PrdA [Acinetobacter sp. RIT592]EQK41331.1 D-proline reductase proprotein prdA [[Clostridium] bifermentans ATCC 638] [Paraclostridium bifermentans ATCC 638 = DSM 14991]MBS5953637.1 D-proline reductase (dithiol) proprotein PrdA [Paraclostridium bifermentans]MBS6507137.1 D-proline reductase (dithiol) proprotein PrdA [Paraclostridium bifermentans]MBU5288648.1 D-proline
MSITVETAKAHAKDPAVCCCRFEAGTVLEPSNLEDPAIFADLEDSGLLTIADDCLTIEQVLGAKLLKTLDALTPITADCVEGVVAVAEEAKEEVKEEVKEVAPVASVAPVSQIAPVNGQTIKIHIGEGRDINLEIPLNVAQGMGVAPVAPVAVAENAEAVEVKAEPVQEAKAMRSLTKKHFKIEKVVFAEETKIDGTTLYLRTPEELTKEAVNSEELVVDMKLEIITPAEYNKYSETIMDVQPIAAKEEGEIGEGVTRVIDGVIMMVTGTDENGVQIGEFGSSEGVLETNIMWGRPGAPDKGDIFIKTQVTVKAGTNMERPGPLAAHCASDYITQEIREALKNAEESLVVDTEELTQYRRPGKKKVVVVKEIMGQGAMHDNLILPVEPVGTLGAKPNVDLGNVPVVLSPLEVLDGGIHALTCIGPASKENSRHYWREPLVIEAMHDEEIDLVGVIFVGSPQVNAEKFYVSKRLGMMIEAMGVDGAIVTTEGFGNNHIDFASHIEQIGKRDVAVVGVSFSAVQGALVVGNEYMKYMIDNNKSKQGIENEVLSNNTLCPEDAVRSLAMLKTVMGGEEVKAAERKWNANVKLNNVELIEKETGKKLELVENEQTLPMSEKRKNIYEKDAK